MRLSLKCRISNRELFIIFVEFVEITSPSFIHCTSVTGGRALCRHVTLISSPLATIFSLSSSILTSGSTKMVFNNYNCIIIMGFNLFTFLSYVYRRYNFSSITGIISKPCARTCESAYSHDRFSG